MCKCVLACVCLGCQILFSVICTIAQVIVGVHSDESYVKLKHKHTIDNTEKRMSNVKKYADQVS